MRQMTIKQENALNNLVADGGSIASAMIKAKYSKKTARTPKKFTESPVVKPKIQSIVKRLEGLRDKVMSEMENKDITQERFTELGKILQGLIHDIQLLSGGETERQIVVVSQEIAEKYETT